MKAVSVVRVPVRHGSLTQSGLGRAAPGAGHGRARSGPSPGPVGAVWTLNTDPRSRRGGMAGARPYKVLGTLVGNRRVGGPAGAGAERGASRDRGPSAPAPRARACSGVASRARDRP